MAKQGDRNRTIDILRGIAAISVIAGHSIQRGMVTGYEENIIFQLIYTFHMPLFMLLAGYTLYLSNPKYDSRFVISKFKRLIIPTIVISYLLYFVRDFEFTGLSPFVKFPDGILEFTTLLLVRPDFLIWFLYVVFVCTIVFYIGNKLFKKYLPIYLLIVVGLLILSPYNGIFGIWRIQLHLPIFIAGYYIAKHKDFVFRYLKYALIPLVIFYVFMADEWSFSSSLPYQWLIAIAGMSILYYLVKVVKIKVVDNVFLFLGKYSLELYLMQCFVLNIGFGEGYVRVWSIFTSATILSIILSVLTKKNKYSNAMLYGHFKWMPKSQKTKKVVTEL